MEAGSKAAVVPLHTSGQVGDAPPASRPSERLPFTVGTLVANRFRLRELFAVGGTSCLYLAWDQYAASGGTDDAHLLIKVPRRLADYDCGPDLIFREVAISRRIRDRRVVAIFDLHQHQGRFFLTQELVRGESLRARLNRTGGHGLQRSAYTAIGRELVNALAAVHRAGMVHRDVKPDNVLLSRDGQLRLIDLGTVRPFRKVAGIGAPPFHGFSPAYASPQALRDEPPHPGDDVYSLACLLYEQIAGQHPFGGLDAQRAEAEAAPPHRPSGIGYFQWRILRSGLAFKRRRRPGSVTRFWNDFTRARRTGAVVATLGTALIATIITAAAAVWLGAVPSANATTPTATATNQEEVEGVD